MEGWRRPGSQIAFRDIELMKLGVKPRCLELFTKAGLNQISDIDGDDELVAAHATEIKAAFRDYDEDPLCVLAKSALKIPLLAVTLLFFKLRTFYSAHLSSDK